MGLGVTLCTCALVFLPLQYICSDNTSSHLGLIYAILGFHFELVGNQLRHTSATLMLANGEHPKIVQSG
jgi:hypothetical protein